MGTFVNSHSWQYAQTGLRLIPLSGILLLKNSLILEASINVIR